MSDKVALWNSFCERYIYDNLGVPLFSTEESKVDVKKYGQDNRLILKRSSEMERLVIKEANKAIEDFKNNTERYEGLIYLMYQMRDRLVIPLYIGKSEKYGKKGNNLSRNIAGIETNKYFFCRWGDNYAYHIGDLSAVVCPGHPENKIHKKYQNWANILFESYPTTEPKLKENVYFWIHAWQKESIGIFPEFGYTPLTALEYQLISIAATLFPESLLNQEGVNRGRRSLWIIWLTFYSMGISEALLCAK